MTTAYPHKTTQGYLCHHRLRGRLLLLLTRGAKEPMPGPALASSSPPASAQMPSAASGDMYICTDTHPCAHTYTHIHTRTHAHARIHVHIHTCNSSGLRLLLPGQPNVHAKEAMNVTTDCRSRPPTHPLLRRRPPHSPHPNGTHAHAHPLASHGRRGCGARRQASVRAQDTARRAQAHPSAVPRTSRAIAKPGLPIRMGRGQPISTPRAAAQHSTQKAQSIPVRGPPRMHAHARQLAIRPPAHEFTRELVISRLCMSVVDGILYDLVKSASQSEAVAAVRWPRLACIHFRQPVMQSVGPVRPSMLQCTTHVCHVTPSPFIYLSV